MAAPPPLDQQGDSIIQDVRAAILPLLGPGGGGGGSATGLPSLAATASDDGNTISASLAALRDALGRLPRGPAAAGSSPQPRPLSQLQPSLTQQLMTEEAERPLLTPGQADELTDLAVSLWDWTVYGLGVADPPPPPHGAPPPPSGPNGGGVTTTAAAADGSSTAGPTAGAAPISQRDVARLRQAACDMLVMAHGATSDVAAAGDDTAARAGPAPAALAAAAAACAAGRLVHCHLDLGMLWRQLGELGQAEVCLSRGGDCWGDARVRGVGAGA